VNNNVVSRAAVSDEPQADTPPQLPKKSRHVSSAARRRQSDRANYELRQGLNTWYALQVDGEN
jgi:hypothetical protein